MRRRMIDPNFWTDSKITELSFNARLLYIGLWQYADDEGLFVEDLKSIKMVLFPDQDFPLKQSYDELAATGFFRFDTMAPIKIVEIRNFRKHQTINRPTPSKLRGLVTFNDDSVSAHATLSDDSLLSKDKLREAKRSKVNNPPSGADEMGKVKTPVKTRRCSLPSDFKVTEAIRGWAQEHGLPSPDNEVEKFKDYHQGKGSVQADWQATFRTWLRNAKVFSANGKPVAASTYAQVKPSGSKYAGLGKS